MLAEGMVAESWRRVDVEFFWWQWRVGGEGGAWNRATCPLLPSELELTILQGPNFIHESASPPAATFTPSVQQPQPLGSPDGNPASFLSGCLATSAPQPPSLSSLSSLVLILTLWGPSVTAALPLNALLSF